MTSNRTATQDLGTSTDMWGESAVQQTETGQRGAWFRESRFAMFIHWGLYSEAAGVWKDRTYYVIAEWLMHAAAIPVREYETLCARFNPVDFDADAWVQLAKDAGMKYIVITAKHHDGFATFKSNASAYNIVDATPFGRDPLKELAEACRKGGLRLGFYYSQYQDWHEPDAAGNTWDFKEPGDFDKYLREKAMPQIEELLTHYGPVALIWFDTPGSISPEASQELLDTVRRLQPDCLVNSRIGNGLGDYATLGDQEIPLTAPDGLWETIDTHNDTWAFARNDHDWKSARELIGRLVRLVALGGNYMLNVGPTGKGVIPAASAAILRQVGDWLRRNADSVYGTARSPIGLQAWGSSTSKDDKLYLHVLQWPANGELWVPGGGAAAHGARFLVNNEPIPLTRDGQHLRLALPQQPPDAPVAVIELALSAPIEPDTGRSYVHNGLANTFGAPFAAVQGARLAKRSWMEKFGDWHHIDVIENWTDGAEARWDFMALQPGTFHLFADYECTAEADYSEFELEVAGMRWHFPAIYTGGGEGLRTRVRHVRLAMVDLPDGPGTIVLRALNTKGANGIIFTGMALEPVGECKE